MSPIVRSKGAASTAGKSTKAKAVATQLATKKTAIHGRSEVDELKKQLAEALDKRSEALKQQDATSEVLRVMSTSSTDVRPVLQAVAERAAFLCQAPFARVLLIDGDELRVAAEHSADGTVQAETHVPLTRGSFTGRAILDGSTVHYADVVPLLETEFPGARENVRRIGIRSVLAVPLMHERNPLGGIFLWRREPEPFATEHVALVKTFANQATIAIDRARLFKETKEALEQQTATSEILRIISSSPGDIESMLKAVVERALKLCDAADATVFLVEGDKLRAAARFGKSTTPVQEGQCISLSRGSVTGRAVIDRVAVHIEDLAGAPEDEFPIGRELQRRLGHRTALSVPLMSEERAIGAIALWRMEVRRFGEKQVALIKTFADQAAIAIENVRLFNETKEALERQIATSDILRVISQSPRDVKPVFDTIVGAALRLCSGASANLFTFDGELLYLAAYARRDTVPNPADDLLGMQQNFPRSPGRDLAGPRAVLTGAVVSIPDVLADDEYAFKEFAVAGGFRSNLAVPLVRDAAPIGALVVGRPEPGPFPDKQIALLQTFADQAVIAIENVRLFTELEARTLQLTRSVNELKALGEVGQAVSSTLELETVLSTIVSRAVKLAGMDGGAIHEYEEAREEFHLRTTHDLPNELVDALRAAPIAKGEGAIGRTAVTRESVQFANIADTDGYQSRVREVLIRHGYRSVLAVPLLREDHLLGALVVARKQSGNFGPELIELLNTFATQSAVAIQNARLFKETQEALEQQRASAEVLATISGSIADTSPVFERILESCERLFDGKLVQINLIGDDCLVHLGAYHGPARERIESMFPFPVDETSATGVAILTRGVVHYAEVDNVSDVPIRAQKFSAAMGIKALIAAPMLWQGRSLGGIVVGRSFPGPFSVKEIALLKTFADQAVIAIQNARLFREIQDKSAQLELASQHKSQFLANMSHELRTPLNAIIGFSEVLSQKMFGEINDKQAEYLGDILQSGQHLLSLINDILDLSKIEAGRMELDVAQFHLPTAMENTLVLVRERAQRRGIRLVRTVDERLGMMRGDERKVKQVLLNLLSNALKFTPDGGQIDVRAEMRDEAAEISVRDTGVGIAPEHQQAVFEEFRQVGTASKKVEGTGLGLAISRKFVELHGGRMFVKSTLGSGSTFTFTLPLQ